jgi:hypothetical protein
MVAQIVSQNFVSMKERLKEKASVDEGSALTDANGNSLWANDPTKPLDQQ